MSGIGSFVGLVGTKFLVFQPAFKLADPRPEGTKYFGNTSSAEDQENQQGDDQKFRKAHSTEVHKGSFAPHSLFCKRILLFRLSARPTLQANNCSKA